MAKNKKQKTNHHRKTVAELSQAEIWDDSALIRSWEEAKREYEYYHSLAAQGIDPEDILDAAEEAEENDSPIPLGLTDQATTYSNDIDAEAEEGEVSDDPTSETTKTNNNLIISQTNSNPPTPHQTPFIGPAPPPSTTTTTTTTKANPQQALHPPIQSNPPTTKDPPSASTGITANTLPSNPTPQPSSSSSAQTLENVKMAYYWAGYYSGLYDGQNQAGQ